MAREHSRSLSHSLTIDETSHITFLDRWLAKALLKAIGYPPISFRLWNREEISPQGIKPEVTLKINSRQSLIKLLIDPEFNFGELYCTRDIDVEGDLSRFLQKLYPSIHYKKRSVVEKLLETMFHRRSYNNTVANSQENIYHHYDIGNEFYARWLDREAMQYTCAYFPDLTMSLEEAQIAKMHHICRKLQLEPGQSVIEAGCGWGGLAMFMAKEYGVNVKAYNISHKQILYARSRVTEEGLTNQVEFIEDDYRNIQGNFDRFVSIGMLEHIGIENYSELGNIIDRSLNVDGFGLVHTIGRNKPCLLNAWIEARIFPGGCPPSLSQMMAIFEPCSFSILDIENLRLHYARTLDHWLERFNANQDNFKEEYDDFFIRTWRLYLAGSIAAFRTGTMQLFQVLFTRPGNNNLNWTRSHLYCHDHTIQ